LSLEFEVEGESSGFTESGTYALPIVDEDLEFEGGTGESAADAGLSLEFDGVDTGEAPAVGGISLDFDQSYSNMSLEFEGAPEGEGLSGAGPGGGDDFMMEFQPTIASGAAGDRPEGFESLSMPGEDEEDIFGMKTVLLPKRKGGEDRQSTQEVGDTRINLARAYIDMGQKDEARALLHEVLQEGTDNQRHEAEEMMRGLS
jgi:FimV-like protein